MPRSLKLLHIEHSPQHVAATVRVLESAGFSVDSRQVRSEVALRTALQDRWDLVISDFAGVNPCDLSALEIVRSHDPGLPFLFVCEELGQERAAEAVRSGAYHCLSKSGMERLGAVVRQALEEMDRQPLSPAAEGGPEPEVLIAERIDAAGRLAGIVAHDLNNMLTVIKGYAGLVLDVLPEEETIRRDIRAIDDAASGAEHLTRRLLAFSRRQPAEPEVLDLNVVLRDLQNPLRQTLGEDIQLAADLAEDLWPVHVDRSHVQQIVTHLVANAREAMPWGGTLDIATRNTPAGAASSRRREDCVTLSVSDTGRGMTPAMRQQIFEPLFTTKPSGGGAGLGLSTVFGMVKQAKGSIRVRSEPGRGSVFDILFPRHGQRVS